ncbi:hypothetical protein HYH02_004206 [Chlamydomonas schloesseri]|uniref:Uncharacterized protein n=1 Tax=Chlamydomonas schloesseri TaxID=2026947 RepID=A0A835WPE5_9CHLO|nr:hypothetical protein HYH02_004206 [Chlamydomonas schloesseri]|eukprot:KAG2450933.1 hypothetical protein HYH02_004206 [Chlamydomonas schloesseri]
MAATSPLVRLRRLALPLALVALCAAAAHGQTVTSAFLTASTTITATLSNSTGSSSDCRSAFSYLDLNNGTKASPFANCTANGTSTVVLTLASAGTYAAGDQLNIKVNQTTLNTTAGAAFIPAAVAVAVPPVIGAATLTASRTLVVKLPLSSNTVPDNFATNMTVCGGAVELRAAGASAAKAAPFEACSLAADVLTLTLKSAGTYAPGDTVNVVSGQSILKFGSTAYAPLASGSVVRPTLTSVSLSSTSTILIGTSGPASLPGNATAAVCNAVFDIALKNGTILPGALSACSVGPGVTAITATLASGTSYSDGMTVTLKANQTALKAGDQSAAAPLFLPPTSALAIAPTILSASLTAADTITVVLPVASTLDTSACNSAFELRAAGSATAKSSPFSACSLTVNNTQAVLTLASASTYTAGDILNVKSGNDKLLAGSTAYVPQSVTVLPTITSATLVSSTVVRVALPVVSSIPTPYSADDCARSIIVAASNSTAAKGITACALSTDKKALLVTLAAAYAPGDTVNVRTGQWQLRAGASVTLGPNYIAGAAPVAILPGLASATLTSATQVVVTLPAASNVPATFSASDCNAAVDLVSAAGASKDTPFAACALGSGNTTLILNLTASAYAIGDTVSVKAAQTTLKVGNVSYTPYSVAITAILLPTTTAVLVSETSIAVALPTGFNSYLPSNLNASDCNAAFVLVSAAGNAKTAPYTSCSVSGTALTLGIAAGTYAAGDSVNVKANNTLFLGSSSSGPAYVPAANGTQIRPTIVAASLVSTTNVFVALSAAASTSAFNGTLCNDALEVTGGSATVFQNCTLTSDGKGINLVLATASSVSTSNTINVKASQTMLKAAGSDAASSPAFARLTTPITINEAKLAGAFLTAANTITAKLSVVADASSAFSSSCTTVFVMAMSNGTARSNPFSSCSLASDGVTVTLVVGTYASGDTLNIKSDQGLLKVFNQGNGPNYPTLSAATTISPAISTAVATSSSTFTVPLPVASNLVAGNCPSVVEVLPAAGSPSKTVTACSLTTNDTVLTVTISGTGAAGTVDAPFAFGDTLNIKSSNAFLKGLSSTGTDYKPVTGVTITVSPSVGSTLVTGSNTVTVTIPGTTTSVPSPITADACNSALSIFPAASSSARSSPFSACTVGASSLTLTLGSTYVAGDRINVKSSQTVLSMTSGTTVLNYMPLPTASTLLPTLVSAKATSATTIVAVLPVTSTFLKTDTLQASLTQSDCDTVLRVVSSSSVQRNLVATGAACDLNSTSNPGALKVTFAGTDSYAPGDKIDIVSASQSLFLAGTGKTGPAYYPRQITIDPAYVLSVMATAADTISVKLPVSSSVYDGSTSISSPLTPAQCSAILEVKGGSNTRGINSCSINADVLTVKLLGNGTDVYTAGDTFNFKDTNVLLRAGGSPSSLAYKALLTAFVINPVFASAAATKTDVIVVTLPTAINTFVDGTSPVTQLDQTKYGNVITFTPSRTIKTATDACVLSGNTLTIKLVGTSTDVFTAGDVINIASAGQSSLRAGSAATGPVYTAWTSDIKIGAAYLTSAKATADNTIVVTLPVNGVFGDGTSAVTVNSKAQCDSIVEVLAGGSASAPRTLDSSTICTVSGTTLTVYLASTNRFAADDTVRIKAGNTILRVGANTGAVFSQASAATVIAAGYASAKTITVKLPVISSVASSAWSCSAVFGLYNSGGSLKASSFSASVTLLNDGSADVCALANGGTTLTVKLDAAMNAGATVNIAALNVAAATTKNLIAGSSSGPKYIVRRTPLTISPRVVSANAISATKIEVVLPVASAFVDSGNNVIDLTKANMTTDQCNTIVTIAGKSLSPVLPCSVSGTVLTVNLATSVAPGDAINIAAGNTILRASSPTTGLVYGATGVAYAASSSAVKITLGYFSAVATDQQYIAVTLPYTAKLFNLPTVSSGAELSSSPTQSNCDSILKILSTASGNTARALAASSSCTIAGTLVTLKLAGSGTDYYAVGDRVDVGPGASTADAMLRGDTAAASVTTTSTAYYQSSSLPTSGVTTILPSFSTAAATSPTTIALKLAVRGYLGTAGIFNGSDCASLVTFTPAKTLATTDACSVSTSSPYVLTMKLAGDGTAAGSFAGGDKVNINNAVAGQTTSLVTSLTSGIQFAAAPAAVTIDPNLASVTAIATNKLEIALSAPSYVGGGTLTVAQCTAALLLSSRSPSGDTPCVLDTAKTKLIVTLDAAYADGETVNVQSQTASTATALRAGTDASGPVYVASASALAVKPTFVSATAKAAQSIEVALPVASSFYSGSSAVSPATLTATECAQVLFVKRADGTARGLSACALDATGLILTVTLASNETFAAGDKINVAASNAATSNGASKPLQAQNTGGGQKFVVRSADVVIAPGYVVAAYAVGPATISVALPVTSFIAANADCSTVVDIRQTGATSAKALAATGACSILSDSTGYYLIVNLDGTGANVFASGDKFTIKANNAALLGGTDSTGKAYAATTAVQVNANIDDAILTGPTTVLVPMAAVTTVSLASKADCDAVFVLYSAGGANRTSPSPISSCSLSTDGLAITLTLSADSYQPGDSINIRKDQTAAKVGVVGGSSGTNLVPYPSAITISPRAFGAAATLVAPTSVALSLPAVSSLPATTAASDCNNAVRYTDVSGTDAVNPFTSCAITSDTKAIALNTASPIYKAGDLMNIKSTNNALRWGPQASGAAYYPAASDVPVFATVATATLVDPSTVVLSLPAVSAVPDNFTVPDCLRAIEFKTSAGVAKNGTVASCSLLPDRLGLQVKLLAAANFSAGDTVNIKPQQAELRVSALATGPSYVPKLAAQVVNPALFANANLTSATAITVRLPFASALAAGSDCKTVLALLGAGGVAKNVSSCTLGADGVTLAVTIPAASFVGGDVLNIVPGQKALTLADGTTAYVPSMAGVLVTPNIVSAALTNATIISVTLPTASVLTGTAAADCNAAVVITSNGSAVASPLSACAVSTDGLTLTLTAAATYKPSTGDMVDVAVNQTVLRAGSATGPAYVPRPSPALITVPSPPPSPPPSPAPSPPPSPPLSTANYSARGLATGPLSCNVLIGADTVTTTSGNFTGLPSYAGKKASFRVSCKDAVTGAVYTDDTVASTLPAGLTGLILSPVTALASASVSDIKSVADLANTNKDYLRLLGVPVNASAYGSATNLLAYDYYVKGYVALETPAVAVLNVEGMVAANLLMYTKFFDGLNASVAGRDISAAEALAAAQYVMAMGLKMATAPLNTSSPSAILDLLNATYSILTDKNTTAGGRRLMQGSAVSFTQLQAQAAALAAAAADSNALVTVQQQKLIAAINAGTSISAADLTNIITEASKVIVTQSTVIASAATGLGSGAISPASFTSSYTGSALTTLVAQQQLAAPPGTDVTDTPSPPSDSDDKKSNTGLIVGLVVGLVGGAIVITLIVVFIVMRRRKQNVAAAGQAAA